MMNEKIVEISKRISYLPASENPLSADVGIISGDRFVWIFDVGSGEAAFETIENIGGEKNIILSHFHEDHSGNLGRLSYENLYCGSFTKTKFGNGREIASPEKFFDGIEILIFPVPSVHAKGSVGLLAEGYAFLGDALYGTMKNGKEAYNANTLKETIAALEKLDAKFFLLSHSKKFLYPKREIIAKLKGLYEKRERREAFIFPDEFLFE